MRGLLKLRHVLGSKPSKTTTYHHIQHVIHNYPHPPAHLLDILCTKFYSPSQTPPAPPSDDYMLGYSKPCAYLMPPSFSIQEYRQALARITRNSTPEKYLLNKTPRNLDKNTLNSLLTLNLRQALGSRYFPSSVALGRHHPHPKPHKPISRGNLRGISLTSRLVNFSSTSFTPD